MNVMQYQHYQTQEPCAAYIPGTQVIGMPNRRGAELVTTKATISAGKQIRFMTKQGGYLEVCGIQTTKGWPQLDFGIDVGVE